MRRLDIGSGRWPRDGYESVDLYEAEARVDHRCTMWELPIEEGTVESIWCVHALEHVPRAQVQPTLREWHRVLCPGGELFVRVPDLRWICSNFLTHPGDAFALAAIFGAQTHEGEYHQTGFTPERCFVTISSQSASPSWSR